MKMRKLLIPALLAMSLSAFAADEPGQMVFAVRVMKGESMVMSANAAAVDGKTTPVSAEKEITYRARAFRENGEIKIIPGTLKTGFAATLTPESQKDGRIKTHITLSFNDLVEIKTMTTADGLEVEAPQTSSRNIIQDITMDQGKATTINAGEYSVQVSVKKI